MPHTLYLVPSGGGVGLTSVALGLLRALDNRGVRVAFFKPIDEHAPGDGPERSGWFISSTSGLSPSSPIPLAQAVRLISAGRKDELFDRVMHGYHASQKDADVIVVEGLVDVQETSGETELNRELVQTLDAQVIVVGALLSTPQADFEQQLEVTASRYGGFGNRRVLGCIVNRVPWPEGTRASLYPGALPPADLALGSHVNVIGVIPENPELMACRTLDIARHLAAEIVHEGDIAQRRVKQITLLARTIANVTDTLRAGSILITPGDRLDVVVLVALAATNDIPISGLLLTGPFEIPTKILELCRPALATGLPVLRVNGSSYDVATALAKMSSEIPSDDLVRAQSSMEFIAAHINADWIASHTRVPIEVRMSPAAFCYQLTERARRAQKRIVLPEGDEPRTVRAAALCAERGIAECILLGKPDEIRRVANAQEIELADSVKLVDPAELRPNYAAPLVERRKHKGMTLANALELLEDNVWLGTMMLELGEVDGLVSGAVHSTANTIRPALQIIKTKPSSSVVSSIFFMCLPEQVVVYGDCAVVPDPDAETLADIALQSADSAARFGLVPRVAMISYSTGESGSGSDVEKVRAATRIAQGRRPDLALDGPLQYDAAAIQEVAATKAPDSPVAGKANVFIFPDLNTGNTTYKAVQRSAHVVSIGPMLQGLRRPVNDLSRGALVDDIVYTIALTAIQADESSASATSRMS